MSADSNPAEAAADPYGDVLDWRDPSLWPDLTKIVTDRDAPVSVYVDKQRRLLTEPLYSSWSGPGDGRPFRALSSVGLYITPEALPVPDVIVAAGQATPQDLLALKHRAWFTWIIGRMPTIAIDIVADANNGEETTKPKAYLIWMIPYHVIYDPLNLLGKGVFRPFHAGPGAGSYVPHESNWFSGLGLGLMLWQGKFEDVDMQWLRWCDQDGNVIPTGKERSEAERQARLTAEARAQAAEELVERLQQQLAQRGGTH